MKNKEIELSVILPCRNEEKGIGFCIDAVKKVIKEHKLNAEIIVSDSSKDNSPEIAKELGAKVVKHNKKGYGVAYLEGFKAAKGKYILCADADGTYDFRDIPKYLFYLKKGYDFVIGNRLKGRMQKKAMPVSHRYIGNPVLSSILRLFFKSRVHDSHCGMRAITRAALDKLNLKTTGMEFASEMVIKSSKAGLKIKEFPVNYYKRKGKPHLSSFSDGWRHLRFMLMYAPNYLFMIPGVILMIIGILIMILFLLGPVQINGITLYNHLIIVGSFLVITAYNIINLGVYAKAYAVSVGFEKRDKLIDFIAKLITFESGMIIGVLLLLISFLLGAVVLLRWVVQGFPEMFNINIIILILTLAILGVQTMFSAFFLSMLLVKKRSA